MVSIPGSTINKIEILLVPGGPRRVEGHVQLHDAKLNSRIKTELESRRLLRPDFVPLLKAFTYEGFHWVDERASRLILSMHADNIARQHGLRTITDEPIGYTLNALSERQTTRQAGVQSQLACSVISTEVPDMIKMLSPEEFVELRKRFEPVRKPFQRAMRELCDDYMLADMSDAATLDCKIREIVQDYHREVEKFRSGRFASAISPGRRLVSESSPTPSAFLGRSHLTWQACVCPWWFSYSRKLGVVVPRTLLKWTPMSRPFGPDFKLWSGASPSLAG